MSPSKVETLIRGYIAKLRAAGLSKEELEFAEEFLTPELKSEDESILDVKAAWVFVRDVAKRKGAKL